ncbi:MAG: porin family protein [Hyphomicrobiales bacterium]|nr:MAG: porin family protein [Hyphomicrobiales bacterium]
MLKLRIPAMGAVVAMAMTLPAVAADLYEPPVVELPPPQIEYRDVPYGGWYIRGDVGYHKSKIDGIEYITYGAGLDCCGNPVPMPGTHEFDYGKLKGSFSAGVGLGYQISSHFRADVTADYWFKSDFRGQTSGTCMGGLPCVSEDTSRFSALLLLANAYAELGTYKRITPYIGAGIGGAHVKWGDLRNQIPPHGIDDRHRGAKGWRFAWALMAGASYCITSNWHADLGYRFSQISGGRMYDYADSSAGGPGSGPGFHGRINTHEVRAGLRYQFGGGAPERCGEEQLVYQPPEPYVPIYK